MCLRSCNADADMLPGQPNKFTISPVFPNPKFITFFLGKFILISPLPSCRWCTADTAPLPSPALSALLLSHCTFYNFFYHYIYPILLLSTTLCTAPLPLHFLHFLQLHLPHTTSPIWNFLLLFCYSAIALSSLLIFQLSSDNALNKLWTWYVHCRK